MQFGMKDSKPWIETLRVDMVEFKPWALNDL